MFVEYDDDETKILKKKGRKLNVLGVSLGVFIFYLLKSRGWNRIINAKKKKNKESPEFDEKNKIEYIFV